MSAPQSSHDEIDELAGEYVLGTLSATQRRDAQARMTHDADLRGGCALGSQAPALDEPVRTD
jgi:anti-sigma-K factor RskA